MVYVRCFIDIELTNVSLARLARTRGRPTRDISAGPDHDLPRVRYGVCEWLIRGTNDSSLSR